MAFKKKKVWIVLLLNSNIHSDSFTIYICTKLFWSNTKQTVFWMRSSLCFIVKLVGQSDSCDTNWNHKALATSINTAILEVKTKRPLDSTAKSLRCFVLYCIRQILLKKQRKWLTVETTVTSAVSCHSLIYWILF